MLALASKDGAATSARLGSALAFTGPGRPRELDRQPRVVWHCARGRQETPAGPALVPMVDTQRVSLPRMDLRLLRYFVAVAEERHFGRAAARLHMSQPPLSRAIKQLEAEVGALLFARSTTGVTLTPVGAVLFDEARALLHHADRVRVRVRAA